METQLQDGNRLGVAHGCGDERGVDCKGRLGMMEMFSMGPCWGIQTSRTCLNR